MSRNSSKINELTIEEVTITVALMNRAILNGQAQMIFEQIGRRNAGVRDWLQYHVDLPLEFEDGPSESRGSMMDAAKRDGPSESRGSMMDAANPDVHELHSPGSSISSEFEVPCSAAAAPVRKPDVVVLSMVIPRASIKEDGSIPMPQDCYDLDDWSTTIVRMKKYADKNWRYSHMVMKAEHDKEVRAYLMKVVKTFGKSMDVPNETQAVDLARFLLRMRWTNRMQWGPGFHRER